MKKTFISFLLTALLCFSACLYLPWWSIAISSFLVSLAIPQRPVKAFLTGFCSVFLLWFFLSFWISSQNNHILAHRIAPLFIKNNSPYMLMLVTALIGALIAGFASLSGSFLQKKKVDS